MRTLGAIVAPGVGTWTTQAELRDIKVTNAGRSSKAISPKTWTGWKTWHGHWEVVDCALRQTSLAED